MGGSRWEKTTCHRIRAISMGRARGRDDDEVRWWEEAAAEQLLLLGEDEEEARPNLQNVEKMLTKF